MRLTIGVSRKPWIGSELIQWWMGTNYSHTYARWYLKTQEREVVYHAAGSMIHFLSLDNFTRHNTVVKEFTLELTDEQFKKFSTKCIDLAGQHYSVIELVQIFICDLSGGRIKFSDQPGYICSELMCELLEDLGVKFDKLKYMVRPDDIVKALEAYCAA